jgi:glycine/D-amino acid oxidase-like deaminating enzyme
VNEPAVEHVERGQAGLSVGYHLARRGLPFLIVDANEWVGDSWRHCWDSLRPSPRPDSTVSTGCDSRRLLTTAPAKTRWRTISRLTPRGSTFRSEPGSQWSG